MGNIMDSVEKNDDLVDKLISLGYLQTKKIERVFRAVDRGDYVLEAHRKSAYKDISWKMGNIHLSAPCVYSRVMESLSLESGLSFLHLGSGTGYLSTMAGLILNHNGTNHGIELNQDCLEYAYEKLEEFKRKSLALDEFDFCEPVFIHGNCLNLQQTRQYDRVYCGASCPESHEAFIKQFVKIGGILVMPYKQNLLRIERTGNNTWKYNAIFPVSFAPLIVPNDDRQQLLQLPYSEPLSLQELSRCTIRNELRKLVWETHPKLLSRNIIKTGGDKLLQLFLTSNSLDAKVLHPKKHLNKKIILSRMNQCSCNIFDHSTIVRNEESSQIKDCDAINIAPFIADTNFPSTSYQNNIEVDTVNDNDNKSPLAEEIVNTEVTDDRSSRINVVDRTNKFFQSDLDTDDAMELDIPTEHSEYNQYTELNNQMDFSLLNKNKFNESKHDQNQSAVKNNYLSFHHDTENEEKASIDLLEFDATRNDSSNNNNNDDDDYNDDDNDDDDDDVDKNSLMDWFNTLDSCQEYRGLPAYKIISEGYPNNYSQQSEIINNENQNLLCLDKSSQVIIHNVDINEFSIRMKERISKLPLPTSLLIYINHNRTF